MLNFLFRILLTFNSTSLLIVVFLIKQQCTIDSMFNCPKLRVIPDALSYIIYFFIPVILTYLSILLANKLGKDSIENTGGKPNIIEVEQANNSFLPSYLGYFFVALSVPYCETLIFVFAILFVFTFFSQTLYFNPLFLLFRFKFYYLTTQNHIKIFVISKKIFKNPDEIVLNDLRRINDFTFIDKSE